MQNVRLIAQNAGHMREIMAAPCKMSAVQHVMTAAACLMFAKDPYTLVSRNDFYDIRNNKKLYI